MVYAVILAGGKGTRLDSSRPKQLLPLGDITVLEWSLETFSAVFEIDSIILVSEPGLKSELESIVSSGKYKKVFRVIDGGAERFDSSSRALECHEFDNDDLILFHDAARPFVSIKIIKNVIEAVKCTGAAGTYVKSSDTISISEKGLISTVLDRNVLRMAQTPQGFKYDIISSAHEYLKKSKLTPTDDISIVLSMGNHVEEVEGSNINFKITNSFDYKVANYHVNANEIKYPVDY